MSSCFLAERAGEEDTCLRQESCNKFKDSLDYSRDPGRLGIDGCGVTHPTRNPSPWEVKAEGPGTQGQPWLCDTLSQNTSSHTGQINNHTLENFGKGIIQHGKIPLPIYNVRMRKLL